MNKCFSLTVLDECIKLINYDFLTNYFRKEFEKKEHINKNLMKINRNLKDYDYIFSYNDYRLLQKDHYLYDLNNNPKNCIFCLRLEPEVTFSTRPHVIPEFLGNRYLLHYEECDSCNSYFSSTLEDSLDKYTKIYRTLDRIKNKKRKLVQYNSINQKSYMKFIKNKENSFIFQQEKNIRQTINKEKNEITHFFEIEKHKPMNVYKAFMKLLYGLLPRDQHKNFTILRQWIMDAEKSVPLLSPLYILKTFIPGFDKKDLHINILHNKKDDCDSKKFSYIALISFGNIAFEMPIFNDNSLIKSISDNEKIEFPRHPLFYNGEFLNDSSQLINLSGNEFIVSEEPIIFGYSHIIELPELIGERLDNIEQRSNEIIDNYHNNSQN